MVPSIPLSSQGLPLSLRYSRGRSLRQGSALHAEKAYRAAILVIHWTGTKPFLKFRSTVLYAVETQQGVMGS